jgi:hypothetical protein
MKEASGICVIFKTSYMISRGSRQGQCCAAERLCRLADRQILVTAVPLARACRLRIAPIEVSAENRRWFRPHPGEVADVHAAPADVVCARDRDRIVVLALGAETLLAKM